MLHNEYNLGKVSEPPNGGNEANKITPSTNEGNDSANFCLSPYIFQWFWSIKNVIIYKLNNIGVMSHDLNNLNFLAKPWKLNNIFSALNKL